MYDPSWLTKENALIAAGLDRISGGAFWPIAELMSAAEFVDKIQAICIKCGNLLPGHKG